MADSSAAGRLRFRVVDFETVGVAEPEYDLRALPGTGPGVELLTATMRHYQRITGRSLSADRVMAWHLRTALGDALWRSEAGIMAVLAARLRHGQEQWIITEPRVEHTVDPQLLRRFPQHREARVFTIIDMASGEQPQPRLHVVHQQDRAPRLIEQREIDTQMLSGRSGTGDPEQFRS